MDPRRVGLRRSTRAGCDRFHEGRGPQ